MRHRDATKHGIDISKSRLDDANREVVRFALGYKGKKVAVDIGCGSGRVSIILALMGFDVWLYDIQDLASYYKRVGEALDISNRLHFKQLDINVMTGEDLPTDITLTIAQRTLHHVRYSNALSVLSTIYKKTIKGGKLYMSLSGIDSKLAENYECIDSPVAERYCEVGEIGKEVYSISGKVCLYTESEVQELVEESKFTLNKLHKSDFGNIKVSCSKSSKEYSAYNQVNSR